jgi:hypothetical protein
MYERQILILMEVDDFRVDVDVAVIDTGDGLPASGTERGGLV